MNVLSSRRAGVALAIALLASTGPAEAARRSTPTRPAPTKARSASTTAPTPTTTTVAPRPAEEAEPEDASPRLLVSDTTQPTVKVYDLATMTLISTLTVTGPARLYTGDSGRYVVATQRDRDTTALIDSGLVPVVHGDHEHLEARAPSIVSTFAGPKPTHVVAHDNDIVVYNDGDGSASMLSERTPTAVRLIASVYGAHHGVAFPTPEGLLTSLAGPGDPLPSGMSLVAMDGAVKMAMPHCPRLHGEAAATNRLGDTVGFGCDDSVLLVRRSPNGAYTWDRYQFPTDRPKGTRTGTLVAAKNAPFLIGNYGGDLGRFDIDGSGWKHLPLPAAQAGFAFDPSRSGSVLALLRNGDLVRINPISGAVTDTVNLMPPLAAPGGEGSASPTLAVGARAAFVSRPTGEVLEIDLKTFSVARRLNTGGSPLTIAIAGR